MEERYYLKVGNCYVAFVGFLHQPVMRADYRKAESFLTFEEAKTEAERCGIRGYKIVKKI